MIKDDDVASNVLLATMKLLVSETKARQRRTVLLWKAFPTPLDFLRVIIWYWKCRGQGRYLGMYFRQKCPSLDCCFL